MGNPAVRHYRGASGNVAMVEMRSHLAIERARTGNPPPTAGAPELYPNNTQQPNLGRTQSRESRPSGLERVREVARKDGKLKFTALLHHVSIDLLRTSYYSLKKQAAPGVDGMTWEEYGTAIQRVLLPFDRQRQSGAAVIDGRDEILGGAKTE